MSEPTKSDTRLARHERAVALINDLDECETGHDMVVRIIRALEAEEKLGRAVESKEVANSTELPVYYVRPLTHCNANRDGECSHPDCPQIRDGEPEKTGRSCPMPHWEDEET